MLKENTSFIMRSLNYNDSLNSGGVMTLRLEPLEVRPSARMDDGLPQLPSMKYGEVLLGFLVKFPLQKKVSQLFLVENSSKTSVSLLFNPVEIY